MKSYWGSGGIIPRILDLGTRRRSASWLGSFPPQTKSHRYTSDRRLGGAQSRSGHGDEEENSQPLPRLEPPIIQLIAQRYTTELSRPSYLMYRRTFNFSLVYLTTLFHLHGIHGIVNDGSGSMSRKCRGLF
jgi:hypothetical protein